MTKGPKLKIKAAFVCISEEPPEDLAHRYEEEEGEYVPTYAVRLDIRNCGNAPDKFESAEIEQDRKRFDRHSVTSPPLHHIRIHLPALIEPQDHLVIDVGSEDVALYSDPGIYGRRLDPHKQTRVFIRTSAFEDEIVVKVDPLPRKRGPTP